jgi:hypothetical protein
LIGPGLAVEQMYTMRTSIGRAGLAYVAGRGEAKLIESVFQQQSFDFSDEMYRIGTSSTG